MVESEVNVTTREDIRQFNEKFSAAAARGDAKTLVAMYDDEAVFLLAGSPSFKGKGALSTLFDEFLSGGPVTMAFESGDIWESGDLVVDVGTYSVGGMSDGRFAVVYRRRPDGTLALLVDVPIRDAG